MPNAPSTFRLHSTPRQGKSREAMWASRRDEKRSVYASAAWKWLREQIYIRDGGQCQICGVIVYMHAKRGTNQLMAICDHKIPAKTAADVLCDESNLWTLCPTCANKKTAGQDGGFGNRKKHEA